MLTAPHYKVDPRITCLSLSLNSTTQQELTITTMILSAYLPKDWKRPSYLYYTVFLDSLHVYNITWTEVVNTA